MKANDTTELLFYAKRKLELKIACEENNSL